MPPSIHKLPTRRTGVIRALMAVLGLLVGLGVYSYGMFHTLMPTSADIKDVEHCGIAAGTPFKVEPMTAYRSTGSFLCQVAPDEWVNTPYGSGPLFLGLATALGFGIFALYRSSVLRLVFASAPRVVTLVAAFWGVPMTLLNLHLTFIEGTLTPKWALRTAFYGMLSGVIVGLIMWYLVSRLLRARIEAKRS
jgi:hypothetical protein